MVNQFYHTTVINEPAFKKQKRILLKDLEEQIRYNYKRQYKKENFLLSDSINNHTTSFNIKNIGIDNLTYDIPYINFNIVYRLENNRDKRSDFQTWSVPVKLNCGSQIISEQKMGEEYISTQQIKFDKSDLNNIIEKYPPWFSIYLADSTEIHLLQSTRKINDAMLNFKVAEDGFPYKIEGSFKRMLYFSATTQTGLGLGDILPLSNYARLTVVVQTSLGLILMGLFLTELGKRFINKELEKKEYTKRKSKNKKSNKKQKSTTKPKKKKKDEINQLKKEDVKNVQKNK